jgi:hypothetical protein
MLGRRAEEIGIKIEIADINDINKYETVIAFDVFWKNKSYYRKIKGKHLQAYQAFKNFNGNKFLILHECDVIHKENWNPKNHEIFDKVFTWNDRLVDNKKYFKLNCAPRDRSKLNLVSQNQKLYFSSMLCSNIINNSQNALYLERKRIINFAIEKDPNLLHLYGKSWDQFKFNQKSFMGRSLNKISNKMSKLGLVNNKYKSVYKGTVTKNINVFLNSSAFRPFSLEAYTETLTHHLKK